MLALVAAARLLFSPRKPFASSPPAGVKRNYYTAVYNDIQSQLDGYTETCKVLVEKHPDGKVHVCFAPDAKSVTGGLSCPPGHVVEGLATGIYHEVLKPQGIRPEQVEFRDHIPAMKFSHGPTWMDKVETKPLWRPDKLSWNGQEFVLSDKPVRMMFDPDLKTGVPRVVRELPFCPADCVLDLRSYVRRPAPCPISAGPGQAGKLSY